MPAPPLRSRPRRAPRPVSWRTILAAVGVSAAVPFGLWATSQPLSIPLLAAVVCLLGWSVRASTRR